MSDSPTSHVDLHPRFSTCSGSRARRPARTCSTAIPRSRAYGTFRHVQPSTPISEAYLDSRRASDDDGRVLDAKACERARLIWRPDVRLDAVMLMRRAKAICLWTGVVARASRANERCERNHLRRAVANRAIIAASLPTSAVELVLRASSPAATGPRSMRVDVDGQPAGQPNLSGPDGYRDIVISIPQNTSRPPVSEITLHFDSGGRESLVFKLDRLIIR